jgi:hypothetical protein
MSQTSDGAMAGKPVQSLCQTSDGSSVAALRAMTDKMAGKPPSAQKSAVVAQLVERIHGNKQVYTDYSERGINKH